MIVFWGLILGLPLLAYGGGVVFCGEKTVSLTERFFVSKIVAAAISAVAWFWTAYECDTIGIDVFDMLLKRFPLQVYVMAAVLTYLTVIWMPKNLPVRALCAILMLIPAELFKTTRLLVPVSGFAYVHVFVAAAYAGAVAGMYGMFYPWRMETAARWLLSRARVACGSVLAALGAMLAVGGFFL